MLTQPCATVPDETVDEPALTRVYLPHTFVHDAQAGMESVIADGTDGAESAWAKVEAAPSVRRGGGTGVWVDLTPAEVDVIRGEAKYRAEYWLTDAYGPDHVQPFERTAGRAAKRVFEALSSAQSSAAPAAGSRSS